MDRVSFFTAAFNVLPEHICIINKVGGIQFVNQSWVDFELNNSPSKPTNWYKTNYFNACTNLSSDSNDDISHVLSGIKAVANREISTFKYEYACHSAKIQRWFLLNCLPFEYNHNPYTILQHVNITKKKQADINSNIDALTGVANRRAFNDFFEKEWLRCVRYRQPISIIIIDIDHFKVFNDTYGHVKGDWCLIVISNELKKLANRPTDMFCRYGGEEFIFVLGNTTSKQAEDICTKVHQALNILNINHKAIKNHPYVTVSIGLACIHPENLADKSQLIEFADKYLYEAKSQGKNRTILHCCKSEICTPENCSYYTK